MISRRNIRVKVMQSLYTLDSISNDVQVKDALTLLRKQVEQSRQLFVYLVYFLTEVARYSEKDARQKASKHLPSAGDLNVNTKIAGNELLWKIIEEPSFKNAADEIKPHHFLDAELLKKTYQALAESEEYKEYVSVQARDKKGEREILQFIFSNLMLPNEDFINHVEEQFINWDDDAEMMNVLMLNFLQKPQSYDFGIFVSKDKMDFARDLLQTTIEKKEVSMELLKPKLKNWDAERIAALDLIIIQMGICEFLFFETIPTKVTINEYIDLAKEYSTPQSGQFINGILDNIHKELTTEGKINKISFKNSKL
ncbi:transcription antitermination factor NusB [Ferruginibacter lapsinanis]|uniref:transcription antitermination factor NusB n=1 Tax=Ferruginibacter lapsinanis TaxID=563172 RepID=UPI001E63C428|nr:transcription antitermination factor NusB [Ferruginibacter lapsinanis]UEG48804.1 transcription antitermination factor NusB [Ferruginibacter lapsinanis]